MIMIKTYFKTAIRSLLKNKVFTLIHISGLAIGISASLVIYLLVSFHLGFDKFEKDKDRIFRVVSNFNFSGEEFHNSGVTSPMGDAIRKELTGLEIVVPFRTYNEDTRVSVPYKDETHPALFKKQGDIIFTDQSFFDLLGYEWLAGSRDKALIKPYQVVITESLSKKYFPSLSASNVIGQELIFNDTVRTMVTGIVKDIKANTDFTFSTFISRATLESTSLKPDDWNEWNTTNGASQLLVKLTAGTPVLKIEKGMYQLYEKYRTKDKDDHSSQNFSLQPLSDLHFNAAYGGYALPLANKPTLYSLMSVAVFLLLLACINFINLSTANATHRAKEIGIRKTLGSSRKQLIAQFLTETFMLTLVATVLSLVLVPLLLKIFEDFIPKDLHFDPIHQPDLFLFLSILDMFVTFLSGLYPAMVLSGYKPVLVLKNQAYANTGRTRSSWLRKSLSVSQFVIAQVFIMATILVSKQINYSINSDQGFKKEAILNLTTSFYDSVKANKYLLAEKIKALPGVKMVSMCTNPPSSNSTWSSTLKYADGKKEVETNVQLKYGDSNYIRLYGLKIVAGNEMTQSDTVNAFVINETYAHILGFHQPENTIGKYIEWNRKQIPIVGVVADFHEMSMHESIKPLAIGSMAKYSRTISIALQSEDHTGNKWNNTINQIEKIWKVIYPKDDFEYTFFDEQIAKYYIQEQHISDLLKWATGLAVFISSLGLLGLVIYSTNIRTKEIGVRKVLGASVTQIVSLISKEFILLISIAFLIATPVAYTVMHKWLQNFAYPTSISWWIFILGLGIMVIVASITLAYQTIRAAKSNPVKSLKVE